MNLRIAICEDEEALRNSIRALLLSFHGEDTVETFGSAEALFDTCRMSGHKPGRTPWDLILLDIRLPGMSGIDAAEHIRGQDEKVQIVFLTSLKEYVFDAFDVEALNYLLKPIDEHKLLEVVQRARRLTAKRTCAMICA